MSIIDFVPLDGDTRSIRVSARLAFALAQKDLAYAINWLREQRFIVPRAEKVLKPFRGYHFHQNWDLPKLIKFRVVAEFERAADLICSQGMIAVLPALLAPIAYGHEEEISVAPLFSLIWNTAGFKCEYGREFHWGCTVTPQGQVPVFYISPGALVSLNTVVNFCADVVEYGIRELLWPGIILRDTIKKRYGGSWGIRVNYDELDYLALFNRYYALNPAVSVPVARALRQLAKKMADAVPWLKNYNCQYRGLRGKHLARLDSRVSVESIAHLQGDIALL